MVGKIPFNFFSNVLGIQLWTNTLATNPFKDGYCEPVWFMSLPDGLDFGNISQVGICSPDLIRPVKTVLYWLSIFGVMPLVLIIALNRKRLDILKEPFWLLTIMGYGLILFILGPFTGAATFRLISYGWPIFLIGLPFLLMKNKKITYKYYNKLFFFNLVISLILIAGEKTSFQIRLFGTVLSLSLIIFVYFMAYQATSAIRPLMGAPRIPKADDESNGNTK